MAHWMPHWTSEDWIAFGTVGNFVVVAVLAGITWRYSRDVRRQADAAEAQAKASEQTLAALLKQQIDERDRVRRDVISFVETALLRVSRWENLLTGSSFPQLPMPLTAILPNAESVTAQAYRLDERVGLRVHSAVEEVHKAELEIKKMSGAAVAQRQTWLGPMIAANSFLRAAREKLGEAGMILTKPDSH